MLSKRSVVLATALILIVACAASADVPPLISYQGKVTESSGVPKADGTYQMTFALYDAATGGNLKWSEVNPTVQVKGGLFSVMLGSVTTFPPGLFDGGNLYFGVAFGNEPEMTPRQQIASVAFAQAAGNGVPVGGIIMWSGAIADIPAGWALCNGQNGTPNLAERFIVGAGGKYPINQPGGNETHSHTVSDHIHEMNHTHGMNHQHTGGTGGASGGGVYSGNDSNPAYRASYLGHTHSFTTDPTRDQTDGTRGYTGGATPGTSTASSLPPYYALAYIMKLH